MVAHITRVRPSRWFAQKQQGVAQEYTSVSGSKRWLEKGHGDLAKDREGAQVGEWLEEGEYRLKKVCRRFTEVERRFKKIHADTLKRRGALHW